MSTILVITSASKTVRAVLRCIDVCPFSCHAWWCRIAYERSRPGGSDIHDESMYISQLNWSHNILISTQMIIVLQSLYGVGLALVKTSLMVLYYRLFGTLKSFRIAIYLTGAIVWAWGFSIVLESFLLCQPVEYNYNPMRPGGGSCGNRNAAFVVAGALNMVTDFMVMLLPVPYIWSLQLATSRKIGLVLTFCLGLL